MAEFVPTGILVHSRKDWPCASCRGDRPGRNFLCLECASFIVASAVKRMENTGSESLSVLEALNALETEAQGSQPVLPWELPWGWLPPRR
jgi:hypothetical protein